MFRTTLVAMGLVEDSSNVKAWNTLSLRGFGIKE